MIAILLLLPWIAMRFTDEVKWDATDFVAAAALLVGAGILYEIAARQTADRRYRVAIGAALFVVVVLLWLEGAVGIV